MKSNNAMQIQFITTQEALQEIMDDAVRKALAARLGDQTPTTEQTIEIVDTKTLCKRLGITEPTVIRWRKKGKIPFLQVGSAVRFNYQEVIKALEVLRKKTR